MSLRIEMLAVLDELAKEPDIEYVTIDDMMGYLGEGTVKHNVQTVMTRIARDGQIGRGETGAGLGGRRRYKILKEIEPVEPIPSIEIEEETLIAKDQVSLERLGEAMYFRLCNLERKLRGSEEKRRDLENKLSEEKRDRANDLRKLNATVKEKNATIEALRARVGKSGKTVPLGEIVRFSQKQS